MNIREEKFLFYNDRVEYRKSVEGQAVVRAFESNNYNEIEHTLNNYYFARNNTWQPHLTYASDDDRRDGIECDKLLAQMYAEQN